mmetsp:Transcript_10384/g.22898  ORF Transcript_10384/g.22898 Transcript_10384/m.22898 type:complete len:245 (+) Transcript_10384:881-1615(+)
MLWSQIGVSLSNSRPPSEIFCAVVGVCCGIPWEAVDRFIGRRVGSTLYFFRSLDPAVKRLRMGNELSIGKKRPHEAPVEGNSKKPKRCKCHHCGQPLSAEIQNLTKIFLCHTGAQKQLVEEVYRLLRIGGKEAFFDVHDILVGETLADAIYNGILSSSHAVLFLSPQFFQKRWPKEELRQIMELWRKGDITVIPIRIGLTHEELEEKSKEISAISSISVDEEGDNAFRAQTIVTEVEKILSRSS